MGAGPAAPRRVRRSAYSRRKLAPCTTAIRRLAAKSSSTDLLKQLENALLIAEAVAGCDGVIANTIFGVAIHTSAAYTLQVRLVAARIALWPDLRTQWRRAPGLYGPTWSSSPRTFRRSCSARCDARRIPTVIYYSPARHAISINSAGATSPPAGDGLRALHIGSLESRKGQDLCSRQLRSSRPRSPLW